jgi:acyl-coenzyme A synthetase/AMP-(fatty) acid ligase
MGSYPTARIADHDRPDRRASANAGMETRVNVVRSILHFGQTRKNEPALVDGTRTITYRELAGLVRRTASHLTTQGLRRGDRIGLCLKDSSDHVIALLGVAHVGGVAVPLDWRARPAENLRFIEGLGLTCLLTEPDTPLTGNFAVLRLDEEWNRAVARAEAVDVPSGDWDHAFVISASSGSTGTPKFTLMTHWQYYFAIAGMFELMGFAGRHRFLCTLPLYYSGGRNSCLAHLLRGDCVVLYPSLFSPNEYVDVVSRERITIGGLVPTMVRQLLASGGHEPLLPGLMALFCTGALLHAEEKRRAARTLTPNFHERYGTAETLAISVLRPEDFADRAESVGQPHSLVEIEIADENDRPLPSWVVGRLRVRGPGLGSPLPGQAETNFRGGWYYPGEIAQLDEDGYIFLQGRTSDVIMRSGAKIYPAEVEMTLVEHAGVVEAAVIGHPGADNEESVIAFVVPRGNLSAGELLAHCRIRLTPHKVPSQIHFLDRLPKNTAGKIDKISLAKVLVEDSAG